MLPDQCSRINAAGVQLIGCGYAGEVQPGYHFLAALDHNVASTVNDWAIPNPGRVVGCRMAVIAERNDLLNQHLKLFVENHLNSVKAV
jgi:hypothetical protein